jgi:hypothetical protein
MVMFPVGRVAILLFVVLLLISLWAMRRELIKTPDSSKKFPSQLDNTTAARPFSEYID